MRDWRRLSPDAITVLTDEDDGVVTIVTAADSASEAAKAATIIADAYISGRPDVGARVVPEATLPGRPVSDGGLARVTLYTAIGALAGVVVAGGQLRNARRRGIRARGERIDDAELSGKLVPVGFAEGTLDIEARRDPDPEHTFFARTQRRPRTKSFQASVHDVESSAATAATPVEQEPITAVSAREHQPTEPDTKPDIQQAPSEHGAERPESRESLTLSSPSGQPKDPTLHGPSADPANRLRS